MNCHYCKRLTYTKRRAPSKDDVRTVDHKIPLCRKGGQNTPENRVICCHKCNHLKGPLTDVEFLAVRHDFQTLRRLVGSVHARLKFREEF